MMRHKAISSMLGALMLAGCMGETSGQDDGWSMLVAEDYAGARAYYSAQLADNPNDPYANLNLGVAYEELGDLQSAAKHYQVAAANGKDSVIDEVASDGRVAGRTTTVARVAQENLSTLGS